MALSIGQEVFWLDTSEPINVEVGVIELPNGNTPSVRRTAKRVLGPRVVVRHIDRLHLSKDEALNAAINECDRRIKKLNRNIRNLNKQFAKGGVA